MAANFAAPARSAERTQATRLHGILLAVLLQLLTLAIVALPRTPEKAVAIGQTHSSPVSQAPKTPHSALQTRGASGDLWADLIIGKPDFGAISPYTTVANKGFWDFGTIVDRSSPGDNKFYLYDAG